LRHSAQLILPIPPQHPRAAEFSSFFRWLDCAPREHI
jgi:hypothetical protein